MEYRALGNSGLKVSPLCLGTMMFGHRTEKAEAERIFGIAKDRGINFVDTADMYAQGASERMIAPLLKNGRDWWILASKVGNPSGQGPHRSGVGRRWILQGLEESLQRLGTDYLDIYYLHFDAKDAPLEETLDTIATLIRAGKVRYFGVSNFRGWRIAELAMLSRAMGIPQPVVCQPYYNAMDRSAEFEILPACEHFRMGVVPYSPLARGVLTGKYLPGESPPADSRAGSKDKRMLETEFRTDSLVIAQKIKNHAEAKGMTPGQFAVRWVLNNRLVTSVLAGPRTPGQWEEYVGALEHDFDPADEGLIDQLVPSGHASTHGYHDPKYPPLGRKSYVASRP